MWSSPPGRSSGRSALLDDRSPNGAGRTGPRRRREESSPRLPADPRWTRAIYGAEALLRRRRSDEPREAAVIAEAAEQGSELFALDSWALSKAFGDVARWPFRINVNLSPRELEEGHLVPRLLEIAAFPESICAGSIWRSPRPRPSKNRKRRVMCELDERARDGAASVVIAQALDERARQLQSVDGKMLLMGER
ncbi:MAG TPA: EAL domain-containing protein [Thermoanaerobaculia bacterium]|nr:EAL domain-containing protein [Thermoanaerobaculia bacterium]